MNTPYRNIFFLLFLITLVSLRSTPLEGSSKDIHPAAVSFLVADLKYSAELGVQLCEVQPARVSGFKGSKYNHGQPDYMAEVLYQALAQYQDTGWFVQRDICDRSFTKRLIEGGWKEHDGIYQLKRDSNFAQLSKIVPENPFSLCDYQGMVYVRMRGLKYEKFKKKHPGVILIDEASFPYTQNKYTMGKIFTGDESLTKLKPKWKRYKKQYRPSLADKIRKDIGSECFVIKPIQGSKGRGVIIVHSDDLDETLLTILKDKKKAKKTRDYSYMYWAIDDMNDHFLVEAYAPSDPVFVPHLDNRPFDGTMRVAFLLFFHEGEVDVVFVDKYWKLPSTSTLEKGSLNTKHKSFGQVPYFHSVDPEIDEAVEEDMTEGLKLMFRKMVGVDDIDYEEAA